MYINIRLNLIANNLFHRVNILAVIDLNHLAVQGYQEQTGHGPDLSHFPLS